MEIEKNIKNLLEQIEQEIYKQGMTKAGLAYRLGVTPGRVTQYFKGYHKITAYNLARLAHAVGLRLIVRSR